MAASVGAADHVKVLRETRDQKQAATGLAEDIGWQPGGEFEPGAAVEHVDDRHIVIPLEKHVDRARSIANRVTDQLGDDQFREREACLIESRRP